MRHHGVDDIGERAVPVVAIEPVGGREVVGHVKVGPAVAVVVPPHGRVALRIAADAGPIGHVGERAVPVVSEKIVPLALRVGRGVQQVRLDEDIEEAVAVEVAEGGHDGGVLYCQAARRRLLPERAVTLVDVEEVRRVEPADIDVQEPVVVHIHERRALLPDRGGGALIPHPRPIRHILEPPVAQVAKKATALGLAHDKEVGKPVAVIVPYRHAGAHGADVEFVDAIRRDPRVRAAGRCRHGIGVVVLGGDPRQPR